MKRLKVFCGICKKIKFYSINRGITKVSSVIACENCRHFFQKLKKNPFSLDCISPIKGSCYSNCSFMKTRCKACWAMQVLDSCPHSNSVYTTLAGWLSEECRAKMRGSPLSAREVTEEMVGKVTMENYVNDEWVELSSTETELEQLPINNEDDETLQETAEVKIRSRSSSIDKPETNPSTTHTEEVPSLSMAELVLDTEEYIDVDEEEAVIDDPVPVEVNNVRNKSSNANFPLGSKTSERIKRKRKKVEYFTKPTVAGRKGKGGIYGPEGKIIRTGVDLCDCLQPDCVGCHFPCPKCRSPKCGNECRVNRKWYYEKVEVEGTKMSWVNRFVPKAS